MKVAAVIACSLSALVQSDSFNSFEHNGQDYSLFEDRGVLRDIKRIEEKVCDNAEDPEDDDAMKAKIFHELSKYFRKYQYGVLSGVNSKPSIEEWHHDPFEKYQYPLHERLDKGFVNEFLDYNKEKFPEFFEPEHSDSHDHDEHISGILSQIHSTMFEGHIHDHDDDGENDGDCAAEKLFDIFHDKHDSNGGVLSMKALLEMQDAIQKYRDDDQWFYDFERNGMSYDGDAFWSFESDFCDCHLYPDQSPIDIDSNNVEMVDDAVAKLNVWRYVSQAFSWANVSELQWNVSFNEHNTWRIEPVVGFDSANLASDSVVWSDPDGNPHVLSHIDVHYGRNNGEGSEHLIDGKAFPLEMQYVFWNLNSADSYDEAVAEGKRRIESGESADKPGSEYTVAIASVLFEVSGNNLYKNKALEKIFSATDATPKMVAFNPKEITPTNIDVPQDQVVPAYSYKGTLTTPDCLPIVKWFVMKDTKKVGQGQMDALHDFTNYGRNYRSVQYSFNGTVQDMGAGISYESL